MPVNVIAHDTRLEGRTPASTSSTIAFEVGGSTPLSDFFRRVVEISDSRGGVRTLYILAHGVLVPSEDTSAIQFCRDFISYRTVHHFAQLNEKVERIVLFVCHAAEDSMTTHGDGDELCRQMAIQAQAEVVAAREDQAYVRREYCTALVFCEEAALDFGDWEGTVVVYDRNGNIVAQFNNPSAWRDDDGVIHDPRREPNPHSGSSDPRAAPRSEGSSIVRDPRTDMTRRPLY